MNGHQLLQNFENSSDRVAKLSREVDYLESRNMWDEKVFQDYKEACKVKIEDKIALQVYITRLEKGY